MKPAPFEYFAPEKIDDVVELLSKHGEDGKILAGGQSLMPLMNLRLARPQVVIDINRVTALEYISQGADDELTIGGSLVHADPAAELPAVSLALGANFVVKSAHGERTIPAEEFFLGTMTTA